jgi:NitT/TauT family transport system ATP-binding protein
MAEMMQLGHGEVVARSHATHASVRVDADAIITVERVSKTFRTPRGLLRALEGINLDVKPREFISLIGRSGCGKTTLLNVIGGLIRPSSGQVSLAGRVVSKPSREVGFVFQQPVMLRWRTVMENLLLPIEIFRLRKSDYVDRARELLESMGLAEFESSYPHQLSGGMAQRVAIARSLLYEPKVLLMDEPFGALDALTREQMNLELLRIWQQTQKTVAFVTHDISEAIFLSDRVVLMARRPGRIRRVIEIDLPRPRSIETTYLPRFADLRRELREGLD